MSYISRFNPYAMDDQTILAVSTGREGPLGLVLSTLEGNLSREGANQHMMIYGPRGRGKSFFIKYLSIKAKEVPALAQTRFILLPEEQSNIKYASDLLRMIRSEIEGTGFSSVIPTWKEPEGAWQKELHFFVTWIKEQRQIEPDFQLVLVLENFPDIKDQFEDQDMHRLRHLMEHVKGFTLLGASPMAAVDGDYNQPIFQAFLPVKLKAWGEEEYLHYFRKRRALRQEITNQHAELTHESKLKAISQYTGGSPRIAVVLTDLLFEDDLLSTAKTLNGLIDDLTPYYQDLMKEIRKRGNSLTLFDALIRGGENLSQSAVAELVGARQNDISKAFSWLLENGYVHGRKKTGGKEFLYSVSDRLMVLYYLDREIKVHQKFSPIWLMADFLVAFYSKEELKSQVEHHMLKLPNSQITKDVMQLYQRKLGNSEFHFTEKRIENDSVRESETHYQSLKKSHIFKWEGERVANLENTEGRPKAFQAGFAILQELNAGKSDIDTFKACTDFFAGLMQAQVSDGLIKDLIDESKRIFEQPEVHVILDAAQAASGYRLAIKENRKQVYLETLHPDVAIFVQAIAKEAEFEAENVQTVPSVSQIAAEPEVQLAKSPRKQARAKS
jgi:hypothetical protein